MSLYFGLVLYVQILTSGQNSKVLSPGPLPLLISPLTLARPEWVQSWKSIVPKASVGLAWVCNSTDHCSESLVLTDGCSLGITLKPTCFPALTGVCADALRSSLWCSPTSRPQQHLKKTALLSIDKKINSSCF